jgi:hypothetical protein
MKQFAIALTGGLGLAYTVAFAMSWGWQKRNQQRIEALRLEEQQALEQQLLEAVAEAGKQLQKQVRGSTNSAFRPAMGWSGPRCRLRIDSKGVFSSQSGHRALQQEARPCTGDDRASLSIGGLIAAASAGDC